MAPKPTSRASKAPHPTAASKAPAKQSSKASAADSKKKKHRRTCKETYSSYIYIVLKWVHPDIGILDNAMAILNLFVNNIFKQIATEASKVAASSKKSTIS